jgi:hypothetical protein
MYAYAAGFCCGGPSEKNEELRMQNEKLWNAPFSISNWGALLQMMTMAPRDILPRALWRCKKLLRSGCLCYI